MDRRRYGQLVRSSLATYTLRAPVRSWTGALLFAELGAHWRGTFEQRPLIDNADYRSPISRTCSFWVATMLCCVCPPPKNGGTMLLEGKKAIITGGTRGIGYAIACRFIEEGAAVTVFGSRQETADAAVEKLTSRLSRGQGLGPFLRSHLARGRNRGLYPGSSRHGRPGYGRQQRRHLPALATSGLHSRRVRQGHGPQRRRRL